MKKNKNFTGILAIALVLVGTIVVVIIAGLSMPKHPDIIQGQAETTDYRLSSKVPARVLEFRVHEGDYVHQGDTLVILEAPDIRAKLSQAEAAYAAAQAQEQKAQNGTRQEQVQQAYEMWQRARAGMDVAEKTYRRINAAERAAHSQYDMAVNGARIEDKAAAGAQVKRAQGAISEVSSYVNETILLAMADGVVTEVFPEIGELVGTGAPIMNISCTDKVWFTFNIREDLLPGLKIGTETEVYVPAIDKNVKVRITKMKDVGSFATWKATKALDGFDLKTFEVEAHPLRPADIEGVRSGMSAIIEKRNTDK